MKELITYNDLQKEFPGDYLDIRIDLISEISKRLHHAIPQQFSKFLYQLINMLLSGLKNSCYEPRECKRIIINQLKDIESLYQIWKEKVLI